MSDTTRQKIQWQPLSALPLIGSMIDGLLDEVETQCETLEACRLKPHVLDDATVRRVIDVYTAQSGDVSLYEEQLSRWAKLELDSRQRQEVERLAQRIPRIRDRIGVILSIAEELKHGTIETVLAKSDFELGLEVLRAKRKP